jgi:hypothetical protein
MVIVEHALQVGSKIRHVLFPVGSNVAIRHFHGHWDCFLVVGSGAAREKTNVFPHKSWVHHHVMNLGAKVSCPTGFGNENFVLDIFVEASQSIMDCFDNGGREIGRGTKGIDQLVVFVYWGGR